jgi:hypothetical protein
MGKRRAKPKFTDVACHNESCRDHLVIGKGSVVGNGTYQLEANILEDTSVAVAEEPFVTAQTLFIMAFILMKTKLI